MCNRRCLHSSMIGMLCTASWDPSRTIQTALRCTRPESFSLPSHWTGSRLCCRSSWRAMSIWVVLGLLNQFTNTIALSLYHNRMWQSKNSEVHVHLVLHCLLVTWFVKVYNGLPVVSWIVSSPTFKLVLPWEERVWETLGSWFASRPTTGCSVLSCAALSSTLKLLLSSDERAWVDPVSTTGFFRSIMFDSFFMKERVSISWERMFSST